VNTINGFQHHIRRWRNRIVISNFGRGENEPVHELKKQMAQGQTVGAGRPRSGAEKEPAACRSDRRRLKPTWNVEKAGAGDPDSGDRLQSRFRKAVGSLKKGNFFLLSRRRVPIAGSSPWAPTYSRSLPAHRRHLKSGQPDPPVAHQNKRQRGRAKGPDNWPPKSSHERGSEEGAHIDWVSRGQCSGVHRSGAIEGLGLTRCYPRSAQPADEPLLSDLDRDIACGKSHRS